MSAVAASLARLARNAAVLVVGTAARAAADGHGANAAGRVVGALLQVANPRSPYAPAVFGAVLAIVLALVWAEIDRRAAASAAQVFRLPSAVATAPLPSPKPLRYAPPR